MMIMTTTMMMMKTKMTMMMMMMMTDKRIKFFLAELSLANSAQRNTMGKKMW